MRMLHQEQHVFRRGSGLLPQVEHGAVAAVLDIVDQLHQLRRSLWTFGSASCHRFVDIAYAG